MNYLYCDIRPNPGESIVDAVIRITPIRERIMSGLALKIMLSRMNPNYYRYDELKGICEFFEIIRNLSNEEFESRYGSYENFIKQNS